MSERDDRVSITRIPDGGRREAAPRPRHVDPGADGPFVPRPVPPPARPRTVLTQTVFEVAPGFIGQYRWRVRQTGKWESWSTRAGPCTIRQPLACDLGEFRSMAVGVPFEPGP